MQRSMTIFVISLIFAVSFVSSTYAVVNGVLLTADSGGGINTEVAELRVASELGSTEIIDVQNLPALAHVASKQIYDRILGDREVLNGRQGVLSDSGNAELPHTLEATKEDLQNSAQGTKIDLALDTAPKKTVVITDKTRISESLTQDAAPSTLGEIPSSELRQGVLVPKPRLRPVEVMLQAAANMKSHPLLFITSAPSPPQSLARQNVALTDADSLGMAAKVDRERQLSEAEKAESGEQGSTVAVVQPSLNAAGVASVSASAVAANDNLIRVALVIGNSAYQNASRLDNPHNDADAITAKLKDIGFRVIEGTDLDKRGLEQKISEFADASAQADIALFFYAGHGIQVAGQNYLVPVDAKVEKPTAVDFELVNVSMVTNYMGGENKVGIVLLDACRDNPFSRSLSRSMGTRSTQVGTGLADIKGQGGGLLVGFATAPDTVAADGEGQKDSPFTTALLNYLSTKGLEVELMMKRVKAEVYNQTKGRQSPWHNSDLRTEVYLAGK